MMAVPFPIGFHMIVRYWSLGLCIAELTFWKLAVHAFVQMPSALFQKELLALDCRILCYVFAPLAALALESILNAFVLKD